MTADWCGCGLHWLLAGQHEITENGTTHMRAGCPRHNTEKGSREMTEDKITSPEAIEAYGAAWASTPAGPPGDRRRAGLQAVANLVAKDRDAMRLALAADVLAWTMGFECADDDGMSAEQYDACFAEAVKALADIDGARADD